MKKREFTEEEISEMKRMYIEEKMGTPSMGKIIGIQIPMPEQPQQ